MWFIQNKTSISLIPSFYNKSYATVVKFYADNSAYNNALYGKVVTNQYNQSSFAILELGALHMGTKAMS